MVGLIGPATTARKSYMDSHDFLGGFLLGMLILIIFGNFWDRALIYLAKHDRCPYCKDEDKECYRP